MTDQTPRKIAEAYPDTIDQYPAMKTIEKKNELPGGQLTNGKRENVRNCPGCRTSPFREMTPKSQKTEF